MARGREPHVDAEQLAALRRLRAAFGYVQVLEVVADDQIAGATVTPTQGTLEGADDRPAEDDAGGAAEGGGVAPPGGDDTGAGGGE
jgi:hypothetical protein